MTMDPGWPHVVQQTVLPLFLGTPRIPGAGCARYARCCFVGLRASAGVTKSMPRPKTQAANPTERDVIFIPAKGIKISPLIAPSPGPGRSARTQLRPKRGPPGCGTQQREVAERGLGNSLGGLGYARTPEVKNTLRAVNIPQGAQNPANLIGREG